VPRGGKEPVSLFNFSFVDILATTIGVIVFIMVLVLLNVATATVPEGTQKKLDDAQQKAKDLQQQADEWEQKADRQRAENLEKQGDEALKAARRDLLDKRQGQKDLRRKVGEALDGTNALEQEVAKVRGEAEQLANAKPKEPKRAEVEFRIPLLKKTEKLPVLFECDGGKVYHMAFEGDLNEGNYSGMNLGQAVIVSRDDGATGDTIKAASGRNSEFMRTLKRMDKRKHFAQFFVRPDSYELYRDLRSYMWRKGYETNWRAYGKDEQFVFGVGAPTGGAVQ